MYLSMTVTIMPTVHAYRIIVDRLMLAVPIEESCCSTFVAFQAMLTTWLGTNAEGTFCNMDLLKIISDIPYSRKFSRDPIFADDWWTTKIKSAK